MLIKTIISQTQQFVQTRLSEDATGHDWEHTKRVRALALQIAQEEGGKLFIIEMAALLHDIADWKFHNGDEKAGSRIAREWLSQFPIKEEDIQHICHIIDHISYKGAHSETIALSLEGQIVQDADRIDALGAIGIARTFAYGGNKNRAIYDPNIPPVLHQNFAAYKNSTGPTINHFYEKLLLLKDRMNTSTGKAIAAKRHRFMEQFLEQFFEEWNIS